jgi:MFS family permease
MYVGSFLVSVLRKKHSSILFTVGSIVGGIGAGILWSAQGSYFALNARYYALSGNTRGAHSLTTFASIFATSLLILEFVVKTGATAMYISSLQGSAGWPWREVVFSTYTAIALCAVVLFWVCVLPLPSISTAYASRATSGMSAVEMQARSTHGLMAVPTSDTPEEEDEDAQGPDPGQSGSESPADSSQAVTSAMHGEHMNEFPATDINGGPSMSSAVRMGHTGAIPDEEYAQDGQEEIISVSDIYSVTNLILTNRAMQLMLPYQLCFGFSAGLVNSYILGVVVKVHIQDGYVGLLSGITALTAGVLSMPFALLANRYARGRWAVMVFGALCFAFAGAVVLCLSDEVLSSWVWIVTFFVIHGAARGVWESTNKAVIALYFSEAETQQAAFSAVYFASGLSGALGFLLSGLASRESIAALNLVISMVALVCYHISS